MTFQFIKSYESKHRRFIFKSYLEYKKGTKGNVILVYTTSMRLTNPFVQITADEECIKQTHLAIGYIVFTT